MFMIAKKKQARKRPEVKFSRNDIYLRLGSMEKIRSEI